MPAINLTQLSTQIAELIKLADDAPAFKQAFLNLLSFYHRYAHRVQKDEIPFTFMRHFDLPDQIIPQLELELQTLPEEKPQETLQIIEALWEDAHFESRDLAAFLLGRLPADYQGEAAARIKNWLEAPIDRAVVRSVLTKATVILKSGTGAAWKTLLQQLLESPHAPVRRHGLAALAGDAARRNLDELPWLFRLTRPFLQHYNEDEQAYLSLLIRALAENSPEETAYFLKQILSDTNTRVIERQFRQYLSCFPPEQQESLNTAIKAHSEREI
ncbi:MAG: DNA alkylation repair protein [Anaerolineaceae bacterium]|jgi:hypothetical protein